MENYLYTSGADQGNDRNCFSHNYFWQSAQLLRSSLRLVWRIHTVAVEQEQGDLLRQSNLIHFSPADLLIMTPTRSDWNSCTRKFIAKVQGTSGKASRTRSIDQDLNWCRIPEKQLKSDKISWQNKLKSSYNLQSQWHVVSTLCQEMKNHLTRKVGFERTQFGPVLEVTTCRLQGKYGVEIRIESENKRQFSLVGQNFQWRE